MSFKVGHCSQLTAAAPAPDLSQLQVVTLKAGGSELPTITESQHRAALSKAIQAERDKIVKELRDGGWVSAAEFVKNA